MIQASIGSPTTERAMQTLQDFAEAWIALADETENGPSYIGEGVGITASWAKNGCLVVIARRGNAQRLQDTLRDERFAYPDNPQNQPRTDYSPALSPSGPPT